MGTIRSLTSAEALVILQAAIKGLTDRGLAASISIVNHDGTEIAKAVMDDVRPFTSNVALLKAKQAAHVGKPTSETRDKVIAGETSAEILGIDPKCLIIWAGGVPIYDSDRKLLGAIGVSNLEEHNDEGIAMIAIREANFKTSP